jgi:hypothetical protein
MFCFKPEASGESAKLPARSEIDDSLKWNIGAMYASIDDWEKDFKGLDAL